MARTPISRKVILASKYRLKRKAIRARMGYTRTKLGNRMPNKFVFKRHGLECKIINTGTGTVALSTPASGWSIGGTSLDDNSLYQFGGAMQFQLNQVQTYTDFVSMFDRYKVSGVKVKFIPLSNVAQPGSPIPYLNYAIDLDDATVPTSYAEINQKYNVHKKRLDKPCSIYIKPRLANTVFNGLTSGYAIGKPQYIDMNNNGVPHYGLKWWIRDCYLPSATGSPLDINTIVRVETTFYLCMKDPQ